jgi:hypothetical protein
VKHGFARACIVTAIAMSCGCGALVGIEDIEAREDASIADATSGDVDNTVDARGGADVSVLIDAGTDAPSDAPAIDAPTIDDASDATAIDANGCGDPGQPCCSGACNAGGCCNAGTCYASGEGVDAGTVCSNGGVVACGATGGPCCQSDRPCNADQCCVDGTCLASSTSCGGTLGMCISGSCNMCGGDNRTCCAGSPSGQGAAPGWCSDPSHGDTCVGTQCKQCGLVGKPCCDRNFCPGGCCNQALNGGMGVCFYDTETCSSTGNTCNGATHVCEGATNCGGIGMPCCAGGVGCTAPFATCSGGQCVACGGSNEPCCANTNGGTGWYCGPPFVCDNTTRECVPCGAKGDRPCPGDVCNNSSLDAISFTCK